jgi:hypothetical protein
VQITEAQIDQVVDETWDEQYAGHVVAGSFSDLIQGMNSTANAIELETSDIQSKIGTPSDLSNGATLAANNVDLYTVASLAFNAADLTNFTIGVAGAGLTAIPTAVWAELRVNNVTAGSMGEGMKRLLAAVFDSAPVAVGLITLSDGSSQLIDANGRTTTPA